MLNVICRGEMLRFWIYFFAYDSKGYLWTKCQIYFEIIDASDHHAGRGSYHYTSSFTFSRFELGERVCDSF